MSFSQFLGVGLGFMLLSALSDSMEHENLLESKEFWNDLQLAVAASDQQDWDADSLSVLGAFANGGDPAPGGPRTLCTPLPIHPSRMWWSWKTRTSRTLAITGFLLDCGQHHRFVARTRKLKRENADSLQSLAEAIMASVRKLRRKLSGG